jgi:cellulose synthase/poly-beta-1,6-N-acetylglucosamine synthase-like glycosyltransferase
MVTLAIFIFWLSVALMFHSYVLYPVLLKLFSAGKKENDVMFTAFDKDLPAVYIVFSVFNEQKVIKEKLESIINTAYPVEKLKVYIGSDNSTDDTHNIVEAFAANHSQISFYKFAGRNGKSGVINKLMAELNQALKPDDVLIFTDANVMFSPATIYEMVKHFKQKSIGQVAANILSRGVTAGGISVQEKTYIQGENRVKYLEGLNWGTMMGAFGACYALRADCWTTIPPNYLMEDFYLSMNVLKQGEKAISELKAVCYEDVSTEVGEEFKRKSRIQAGNFQNLGVYWKLLLGFNAVAFCFFSHKVIRWFGPLFIVGAYVSNLFLLTQGRFYLFTFIVQNLLLLSPVVDAILKQVGVHLIVLRFASYFYAMNLALVNGFWMYVRGIKTNAWSPTKRNV